MKLLRLSNTGKDGFILTDFPRVVQEAEMLEELTYSKMLEDEASASENLTRILKGIPIPNGKAIIIG